VGGEDAIRASLHVLELLKKIGTDSIAGTRAERHNEWRDRQADPPLGPVYGAQKVAKTKLADLTVVLDVDELKL
jgi:hypothetical protein